MTVFNLARGVLGVLADIAVELVRPHRCPISGCDFKNQNLGVVAVHAKRCHEGIN